MKYLLGCIEMQIFKKKCTVVLQTCKRSSQDALKLKKDNY